jgi:hypothetical protein
MNSREFSQKSNKNKFSAFVEQRKAQAKVPKVKKILSPEKIAEKELGLQAFLEDKAHRKALRSKGRR